MSMSAALFMAQARFVTADHFPLPCRPHKRILSAPATNRICAMSLRPDFLSALAAFESAARHQNFSHAGEELHLTASAVSHHVRKLEARLGVPCSSATRAA
jgi:hypothetical protein